MRALSFLLLMLLTAVVYAQDSWVKAPSVSGIFYTADGQELSRQIDDFLKELSNVGSTDTAEALIVPHAGYIYSGRIAAYAYQAASKGRYNTVVVLAPSHFKAFDGIALWKEGVFKTPLGDLEVDADFVSRLSGQDLPYGPRDAFEREHALEVQLPFIKKVFGDVKIVPVLMGSPDADICRRVAVLLNQIIGQRKDVLIIASSDLSHYFPYDDANKMDREAVERIQAGDLPALWEAAMAGKIEMCGFVPVMTLLMYAQERGLKGRLLKYANSGDTAGDKAKVVGYASFVFDRRQEALSDQHKKELLGLARKTLNAFVREGKTPEITTDDPRLQELQGAFVTLRKDKELRGCIGHIIAQGPLWQTVREMTVAAASKDPRFNKVTPDELDRISLEISVLSTPKPVADVAQIVMGRDGVILSDGHMHQGVFLPQVAQETGWSREEFLSELCRQKAGLRADCFKDPKTRLMTFQADVFAEKEK